MNTAQATPLPTRDRHDPADLVRGLEEDGFALMPGALDADEIAAARAAIDALEYLPGDNDGSKNGIHHFKCVFNRDPFWLRFLDREGIVDALDAILGQECHLIGMSAWRTEPGGGGEGKNLHIDQIFVPMDEELLTGGRVRLPMFLGTLHYYLADVDEDLCPTWIVPGSHLSGRAPGNPAIPAGHHSTLGGDEHSWNGIPEVPVLVDAGTAMLFRSELWHRGSKNRTRDRTRYLLQVHYGQRGIAQRFPNWLDFRYDRGVLAAASERQLRLLGKHPISAYG